jgi:hypothetical protein
MKSPYERYIKIAVITVAIAYGINLLYGLTPHISLKPRSEGQGKC